MLNGIEIDGSESRVPSEVLSGIDVFNFGNRVLTEVLSDIEKSTREPYSILGGAKCSPADIIFVTTGPGCS